MLVFQLWAIRDILYGKVLRSPRTATAYRDAVFNSLAVGKAMQSTSILTKAESQKKRRKCSISTLNSFLLRLANDIDIDIDVFTLRPNRFLLFTNLSGIGGCSLTCFRLCKCRRQHCPHSLGPRSFHTIVAWPVETCREISLIQ
jgi:hypothetical protein